MGLWFSRKAAEPARPHVPAWLQGEGEAGGFARGYEAQLDEVYRRNPVGLRAVRLVSSLVGGLPIYVSEGPEVAAELIKSPGLMERAAASLLLHGNSYVRVAVDGHDRPAELHLMRPERVSVACGDDGWPAAYLYRGGGQVTRIAKADALGRQQVAHLKGLNPIGACYLIAPSATGDWVGQEGSIANFTDGGWRFIAPVDGARVLNRASGELIVMRGGSWETGILHVQEVRIDGQTVVRHRRAAIAEPAGGAVIDGECRAALTAILVAMRAHGLIE